MTSTFRSTTEKLEQLAAKARSLLDKDKATAVFLLYISSIWVTLGFPAIIAFAPQYLPKLDANGVYYFWIIIILVHVVFGFIDFRGKTPGVPQLVADLANFKEEQASQLHHLRDEVAEEKRRNRKVTNYWSSQKFALSLLSRLAFRSDAMFACCDTRRDVVYKLKSAINSFVMVLGQERENLFEYESSGRYNIVVYIYIPRDNRLKVLGRNCDNRLGKNNREWEPGRGHVGLTFLHNTEKLSLDITRSPEFFDGDEIESDSENYRSFFSLPIPSFRRDGEPCGVFVVTSANSDQFNKERDGDFLVTCTHLLAIIIDRAIQRNSALPAVGGDNESKG